MTTEHHPLCDDDGWDRPGGCVIKTDFPADACWCRLDEPCHADVLLELANSSSPVGVDASLPGSATDGAVAAGPVAGSTPISPSVSPATGPRTERMT